MDGHMFDGLIPALLIMGAIVGGIIVGLVWLVISLVS